MKAWGEGKLREYLAPDLAELDAAEAGTESTSLHTCRGIVTTLATNYHQLPRTFPVVETQN